MAAPPTGILFDDPRAKPLSVTGQFQAGCYLIFYLTGTTTPANVYADGLLTTPLSQVPHTGGCTAASDGRFVPIYMDPKVIYRVQLFNALNVQLEDTDPYVVPASFGLFTQTILGSILFPATPAEITASATITNFSYQAGDIRRYGATTASLDNTVAVQAAINASQFGQRWYVPYGVWQVASTNALGAFTLYSNTTGFGDGGDFSTIKLTGTGTCHLFTGLDLVNVSVDGIGFYGNSAVAINNYFMGYALNLATDVGAVGPLGHFSIKNCRFDNFRGTYWIWIDNLSSTVDLVNIRIQQCNFFSYTGNAISTGIGTSSDCIGIAGSEVNPTFIRDVDVSGNFANGTFIKRFCDNWGGVSDMEVHHNILHGFGTDAFFADDSGCYALLDYQQVGTQPSVNVSFHDNIIYGVRDCGIYNASQNDITIHGNIITNQTSTADGTLLKGAIASSGKYAHIYGNKMFNCARNIQWLGQSAAHEALIENNQIIEPLAGSTCIKILTAPAIQAKAVSITGNRLIATVNASVLGVDIVSIATTGFKSVKIHDNQFECSGRQILLDEPSTSDAFIGALDITNNQFGIGAGSGINLATSVTPRIHIRGNTFYPGASYVNTADCIDSGGTGYVVIADNDFQNFSTGTGVCLNLVGSLTGSQLMNNRFQNTPVAQRATAGGLGTALPIWVGEPGDFVQNVNPVVTGTGGFGTVNQKSMLLGWMYDGTGATWNKSLLLTGT